MSLGRNWAGGRQGGAIVFRPRTIAVCLLTLPGVFFVLLIVAALLHRKAPKVARGIALSAVLGFYALCTWTGAFVVESMACRDSDLTQAQLQAHDCQAIVVLGGERVIPELELAGTTVTGWASPTRTRQAAALHELTGLPVLASGERGTEAMVNLLEMLGVKEVWSEDQSRNTWENATLCAEVLREHQVKSIFLVTDAVHSYRARRSFEEAGFKVLSAPTARYRAGAFTHGLYCLLPEFGSLEVSATAGREVVGNLVYELFYY